MRACVRACVRVCACGCVRACVSAFGCSLAGPADLTEISLTFAAQMLVQGGLAPTFKEARARPPARLARRRRRAAQQRNGSGRRTEARLGLVGTHSTDSTQRVSAVLTLTRGYRGFAAWR